MEEARVGSMAWLGRLGETWDRGASVAVLVPNATFLAGSLEDSQGVEPQLPATVLPLQGQRWAMGMSPSSLCYSRRLPAREAQLPLS